jgi:hypothetical protein
MAFRPNWSAKEDQILITHTAVPHATTRARQALRLSGYTRSLSAIYSRMRIQRKLK